MTPSIQQPTPLLLSPRVLWFGLFGAAVAWSAQELIGYTVVAHSCYPDWRPRNLPIVAGTWPLAAGVCVLALLVGAAATGTAWRAWRRTELRSPGIGATTMQGGEDRVRFMALSGVLVSGMMVFAIVLTLVALFLVPVCG